jgi:hypothetical protein
LIVAFDNTFLSLAFNPSTPPTPNPATGKPVTHCSKRIDALIDILSKRRDTVLIPTPCLAELLCAVPDVSKAIEEIDRSGAFQPAPFDARCSIELADEIRKSRSNGDKKGGVKAGWSEIKFDRQIAVIAKVNGADIFYTDDQNQSEFARQIGLAVKHTWDLELPSEYAQIDFIKDNDDLSNDTA